jgi:nucleoside-diphosphate-sugar epimerase
LKNINPHLLIFTFIYQLAYGILMTCKSSQHILVTGGAGFIGSSLIPVLLSKGYHVIAVDRLSSSKKRNLESLLSLDNFEFIQLGLLDFNELNKVIKKSDLIYHLAANH